MLPRTYKLKRDNDFKKVFKDGRYQSGGVVKIKFLKNNLTISRFAFLVGKKISKKATKRNKIRRIMEESIRLKFEQIKTGFDVVVLVSPDILNKKYQEIEKDLVGLLQKSKLLAEE